MISVKELIALAKAQPGQLHYGSAGAGGNTHLAAELFKMHANVAIVHVPYRGTGPATTALLAGEVQMMFATLPPTLAQIRAGKLRGLAITSARRSAALPDIPTIAESGLAGYEAVGWWGLIAPGATPRGVIAVLNAAVVKVLGAEETKAHFFREGIEAAGGSPETYAAYIRTENQKWTQVFKTANIRID